MGAFELYMQLLAIRRTGQRVPRPFPPGHQRLNNIGKLIRIMILWKDKELHMRRRSFLGMLSWAAVGASQTKEALLNRPKVPGALSLRARRRTNKVTETELRW